MKYYKPKELFVTALGAVVTATTPFSLPNAYFYFNPDSQTNRYLLFIAGCILCVFLLLVYAVIKLMTIVTAQQKHIKKTQDSYKADIDSLKAQHLKEVTIIKSNQAQKNKNSSEVTQFLEAVGLYLSQHGEPHYDLRIEKNFFSSYAKALPLVSEEAQMCMKAICNNVRENNFKACFSNLESFTVKIAEDGMYNI